MSTTTAADPDLTLDEQRSAFARWLTDHADELDAHRHHPLGDLDDAFDHERPLVQLLFEGGWTRLGWPTEVGGLGGSPIARGAVLEDLAAAGYRIPEQVSLIEIIAPMLVRWRPELAAAQLPAALRGDEVWCQGFSEPDAGSDLGSLRTRAVADGDGYRITGQKMWSSNGHLSRSCCLLARTGAPDSRHRGLTMFWIDLDWPGVRVVPTACVSGRAEVAELFLDDVFVPADRVVGGVDEGWGVVMYLLQFERGAYAWFRQAEMLSDLGELVATVGDPPPEAATSLGEAYLAVQALRSRCASTFEALGDGVELGPEISIDKILMGRAEQAVTESVRRLRWPLLELDDSDEGEIWRRRWAYSRITTIYGGAAEVQLDLVAERLLGLPRSR